MKKKFQNQLWGRRYAQRSVSTITYLELIWRKGKVLHIIIWLWFI